MPELSDLNLNKQLYRESVSSDGDYYTPESLSGVVSGSSSSSSSETVPETITSGEILGNLIMVNGFIRSKGYVASVAGWTINADGTAEFKDLTLTGGIFKYGKTGFTDSTNAGYYFDSEGMYIGAASDASKLKYTIADGSFDLIGTISSRSTATIASAINASGNLITDLINARLDSSTKKILSDFNFGTTDYAGAVKSGTITWNTTTGVITGGSGVVVYRGGIVGVNTGVATFTLDASTGNATFAGTLVAAAGTLGSITAGTLSGVTMSIGTGNNIFKADSNGIYLGNATFASAPFRVDMTGALTATSATISGAITITSGSGITSLSDAGDLATADTADFATQVSGAEKPANNATVGATWGTNLSNIPSTLGTPSADGLYLTSTYLGFYKSSAWNSYIKNDGSFYFAGDAGSHIDWNVTTPATMTIAGAISATSGSVIATSYLSGTVGLANTNIAAQGWTSTLIFSATDYRVVAWATGIITTSAGTAYNITGANTGNMTATTYIYLDIAVSTTLLQITTTAATAIGSGKILITVASSNTDITSKAQYQVFGGTGGQRIFVDNISANSASTNEFISNSAQIANLIVTNAKINSLDVAKLTAGTISSKAFVLAITAGTGDSYIAGGNNLDYTNWRGGDASGGALIYGLDDSDSDKAKFFVGNYSTNEYIQFDGVNFLINGINSSNVVEGATADINYGLFRGSNVDGLTKAEFNATITRYPLTTYATHSTAGYWSLMSGQLGYKDNTTKFDWTSNYSYFCRLKSDTGLAPGTYQGKDYFWGLADDSATATTIAAEHSLAYGIAFFRGRSMPLSHIGFVVDWDNKLYATSGSGLSVTGNYCASQDITYLSTVTHTNFNNYKIETSYASFPDITNTGFLRATAGSGATWSNVSNAYDADTNTYAEGSGYNTSPVVYISWDGGTTFARGIISPSASNTKTVVLVGGQYDTWGRTWSVGDFSNANFKFRLAQHNSSYSDTMASPLDLTNFNFDTSTWKEITGIEIEVTQKLRSEYGSPINIYDVRIKVYFTTTYNTGYVKFYVNDTLVATHTSSIPRSTTDNPQIMFSSYVGQNVSSNKHIWYNNYKVKIE